MKKIIIIGLSFVSFAVCGQINYSKLIVGRTTGEQVMHDGVPLRIFGFAETLGASITTPGPTIEITEGDSIEIDFWNMSQGAPHTIHLHGLDVDQQNDGVPSLSFDVHHTEHGFYRFKAPHPGTYIYHCHVVSTIHVQAGMYGALIVRPASGNNNLTWDGGEAFDSEILWTTAEMDSNWHTDSVLNHLYDSINTEPVMVPGEYSPQYFLLNGFSENQLADPINYFVVQESANTYARLVNVGYYGVRYNFPSVLNSRIIASDGRPLPTDENTTTVEVLPGERYGVMLEIGSDPFYMVDIEYFNLNTGVVESTQTATLQTSAVGLNESNGDDFTIYPIPSSNGVFYSTNSFEEDYYIFDLKGAIVHSSKSTIINLEDRSPGIYYLHYKGTSKKLVIF